MAKTATARSAAPDARRQSSDKHRTRIHQRRQQPAGDCGQRDAHLLGQCGAMTSTRRVIARAKLDGGEVETGLPRRSKASTAHGSGARRHLPLLRTERLNGNQLVGGPVWPTASNGTSSSSARSRAPRHRRRRRPHLLGEPGRGSDRAQALTSPNRPCEEAPIETDFIPGAGHPQGLAVDAAHLYWSANGEIAAQPRQRPLPLRRRRAANELDDLTSTPATTNGAEVQGVLGISEDGTARLLRRQRRPRRRRRPATRGTARGTRLEVSNSQATATSTWRRKDGWRATSFIARLDADGGTTTDATELGRHAGVIVQVRKTARVSPDGSTLLFRSQEKLTDYDNEGTPELYRYRVEARARAASPATRRRRRRAGRARLGRSAFRR